MDIHLDVSRLGIYPLLFTSPSGDSCTLLSCVNSVVLNMGSPRGNAFGLVQNVLTGLIIFNISNVTVDMYH